MQSIARDLYHLGGFPRYAINQYLLGNERDGFVLLDAGTRWAARWLRRQLAGRRVVAHALTHVHPDHQGASRAVCEALGVPLWCGERGVEDMERGSVEKQLPPHPIPRGFHWVWTGPPHPVDRVLCEGDEVAGFRVLETPGHAPSHLSFWREADGVLICGDVVANQWLFRDSPYLTEPTEIYTPDPPRNRESARRLAALNPRIVCFGHGPPLHDTQIFIDFVKGLPHD